MSYNWDEQREYLRIQAEKLLSQQNYAAGNASMLEFEKIVHDLSVHQIELELQNEELQRSQRQAEIARDNYARLYNQAPVGYLSLNEQGIILQTNQTFADMVGLRPESIVGKTLAHFIPSPEQNIFLGRFRAFFNSPHGKTIETTLARSAKNIAIQLSARRENEMMGRPLTQSSRESVLFVIAVDITRQKQAENAQRQNEELFRFAFSHANVGMCMLNSSLRLTSVNTRLAEILGYSTEELQSLKFTDLLAPQNVPDTSAIQSLFQAKKDRIHYEQCLRHKSGKKIWTQISGAVILDENSAPKSVITVIHDITESKEKEQTLKEEKRTLEVQNEELTEAVQTEKELGRLDPLTGINNRRYFFELAEREMENSAHSQKPLSVLMMDLDHFKQINDTYGHQAGDQCLTQIARLARQQLRDEDIFARYGGEEFIAMLPNINLSQGYKIAERIRASIMEHTTFTKDEEVRVTISIGIAELIPHADDLHSLINRADQALYIAKNSGRNNTARYHPPKPLYPPYP
jgi:diguanylate cyclase (GGDEF)-like protein/PAS domain S-box-containing protein